MNPIYLLGLFALLLSFLAMLPGVASAGGEAPADAVWDQNSWRDIIAQDCKVFFDGCNNCRRATQDSRAAACTRKACAEYRKPRCLDDEAQPATGARPASKTVEWACADGNTFSVVYRESVQGDQKTSLEESEVMLRDLQTHTVYRLQRQVSASGEKYSDASGIEFFAKGDDAMLRHGQTRIYNHCRRKP
jgi:membrane-bound inhibitor of C-type lysozyme